MGEADPGPDKAAGAGTEACSGVRSRGHLRCLPADRMRGCVLGRLLLKNLEEVVESVDVTPSERLRGATFTRPSDGR